MENIEQLLSSVMNDPKTMEKLMAFAGTLNEQGPAAQAAGSGTDGGFAGMDMDMVKKLSALAGKTGMDNNQRALLSALQPYIGASRLRRLERAMQASQMAGMVTGLLEG